MQFIKLWLITFFTCVPLLVSSQVTTIVQTGHQSPVMEIAVNRDETILATTDGIEIRLWDIESGYEFKNLSIGQGKIYPITNLHFVRLDSNRMILAYLHNNRVVYQDIETEELVLVGDKWIEQKDSIGPIDRLRIDHPNWDTNPDEAKAYLRDLNKFNKRQDSFWKELEEGREFNMISHVYGEAVYRLSRSLRPITSKDVKEVEAINKKIHTSNRKLRRQLAQGKLQADSTQYVLSIPLPRIGEKCIVLELWKLSDSKGLIKQKKPVSSVYLPQSAYYGKDPLSQKIDEVAVNEMFVEGNYVFRINETEKKFPFLEPIYHLGDKSSESIVQKSDPKGKPTSEWVYREHAIAIQDSENSKFSVVNCESVPGSSATWFIDVSHDKSGTAMRRWLSNEEDNRSEYWKIPKGEKGNFVFAPSIKFVPYHLDDSVHSTYVIGSTMLALSTNGKRYSITDKGGLMIKEESSTTSHVLDLESGESGNYYAVEIPDSKEYHRISVYSSELVDPYKIIGTEAAPISVQFKEIVDQFMVVNSVSPFSKRDEFGLSERRIDLNSGLATDRWTLNRAQFNELYKTTLSVDTISNNYVLYPMGIPLQGSINVDTAYFNSSEDVAIGIKGNYVWIWDAKSGEVKVERELNLNGGRMIDHLFCSRSASTCLYIIDASRRKVAVLDEHLAIRDSLILPKTIDLYKVAGITGKVGKKGKLISDVSAASILKDIDLSTEQRNPSELLGELMSDFIETPITVYESPMIDKVWFTEDGKKAIIWEGNGARVLLYDLSGRPNEIERRSPLKIRFAQASLRRFYEFMIPDDEASSHDDQRRKIVSLMIESVKLIKYSTSTDDLRYLAYIDPLKVRGTQFFVFDLVSGDKHKLKDNALSMDRIALSSDGRLLAASTTEKNYNLIRLYNVKSGTILATYFGHSGDLAFSMDDSKLICSGSDRQITIWQVDTSGSWNASPILRYIDAGENSSDYLILDAEYNYFSTGKGLDLVAFAQGNAAYPLVQFDLIKHRPDLVVGRTNQLLKSPDTLWREMYEVLVKERQKDFNFENVQIKDLGEIRVKPNLISLSEDRLKARFEVHTIAEGGDVEAVRIFVNNVLDTTVIVGSSDYRFALEVVLSSGQNRIQFQSVHELGYSSSIKEILVNCEAPPIRKPILYLAIIGVDSVEGEKDAIVPLTFSVAKLKTLADNFGDRIRVVTFSGSKVIKDSIDVQLDSFFGDIQENDVAVMYIGSKFTWCASDSCLVMYGKSESTTIGALSENLADLRSRNRVVFVDACYAGSGYSEKDSSKYVMQKQFISLNDDIGVSLVASTEAYQKIDYSRRRSTSLVQWLVNVINSTRMFDVQGLLHDLKYYGEKDEKDSPPYIVKQNRLSTGIVQFD